MLGDIADIITGPFGSALHKSDYQKEGTPVIMPQDIGDRTLSLDDIARIGDEDVRRLARYATVENDIVYARRGDVEKHAFITKNEAGALCGTGCLRVRIDGNKADPLFVSFFLNRPESRTWLRQHAVGSNMPNLNTDILSALPLDLPNIEAQQRIGNLLRVIDDKIENDRKLMAELEATARLLYDEWFVRFDFPDEQGRPYRSSGGKMVWNDELKRGIPAGWEAGTINQLGSIVSGATPSTNVPENYADGTIAWITPNDLSKLGCSMFIWAGERNISERGLASCSAQLMPAGSVLMSSRAPIGYLAIAAEDCCTNQGCKSLVADRGYGSSFVYFSLKHFMPLIESQGAGTTFKEVSGSVLGSVRLPLPSQYLTSTFEESVKPLMGRERNTEREVDSLTSLRDWLLPMLMNGQVKVG